MRTTLTTLALLSLIGCGGHDAVPIVDGPGSTVTLYCYETLADPGCYLLPDPGRGNRLLAVVDVPWSPEIALIETGDAE